MRLQRTVLAVLGAMLVLGTASAAEKAVTVACKDGTTSKAGRGACSHHGGVAQGLNGSGQ
jgi:hypothetical protein